MARQLKIDEIWDPNPQMKTYLGWLEDKCLLCGPLAELLYGTDFYYSPSISEDGDRVKQALILREDYASEVGSGLDEVLQDRLWKSIHGQCSLFEMMISLAMSLDEMLNEDPDKDMVSDFFHILLENAGYTLYDEEDWDAPKGEEICTDYWKRVSSRVLDRRYEMNGKGGLFPLQSVPLKDGMVVDRRTVGLWQQLQDWVDEHTDEECNFVIE